MEEKGYLTEVFSSIQGEGLYVGVRQIFVRTAGCSLGCCYCDTPSARVREPECRFIGPGGTERVRNPVSAGIVVSFIHDLALALPGVHSISITGGEPLEQPGFVAGFLRALRSEGLAVHLETNGRAIGALERIAPLVDIISLDIKLPSLCGGGDFLGQYGQVLALLDGREFFCKIVLADGFDGGEFKEAVRLIARSDPGIPLIIQPATPAGECRGIDGEMLLRCFGEASKALRSVRVIPQCHRLLGLP